MKMTVLQRGTVMASERICGRFNWPTVARLPDGRLLTVASGFRMTHVCPFGKVTGAYSEDDGKSWSLPTVFIDTPLDDRDAGIAVQGNRVIITSFNESRACTAASDWQITPGKKALREAYQALITDAEETEWLGSEYILSEDGGKTFSEVRKAPVTSPHGPLFLPDGSLYYVGTECHTEVQENGLPELKIDPAIYYAVSRDGSRFESPVKIPVPMKEGDGLWEPHACLMPSGRVVLAVRVQTGMDCQHLICRCSYSDDGGRTYAPFRDVEGFGGPPHLCPVGEGRVVLTYGYRFSPYGIRARLSVDNGETFGEEFILCDDLSDQDLGYPATILCRDGAFLTVYYGRREEEKNTGVYYVRWRLSEE